MFSEAFLTERGLETISKRFFLYKCVTCGQIITPEFNTNGHLVKNWWLCPNGCNRGNVWEVDFNG